jgi:hypothetical protein
MNSFALPQSSQKWMVSRTFPTTRADDPVFPRSMLCLVKITICRVISQMDRSRKAR